VIGCAGYARCVISCQRIDFVTGRIGSACCSGSAGKACAVLTSSADVGRLTAAGIKASTLSVDKAAARSGRSVSAAADIVDTAAAAACDAGADRCVHIAAAATGTTTGCAAFGSAAAAAVAFSMSLSGTVAGRHRR
jgi:hypothetical protein